jgi:hypothetical protein
MLRGAYPSGGTNMAKPKLVLEGSKEERETLLTRIQNELKQTDRDVEDRSKVYKMRRDFWEGKHQLYTNVVGLRGKEREGHINAVFNYVWKMGEKLHESLTNFPFRLKMISEDESNEQENIRTESLERAIVRVLDDNDFHEVIFDRSSAVQVRDGDFAIKCTVQKNEEEGPFIRIEHVENMEKLHVMWDDSAGKSFSSIALVDEWTLEKISQEFDGYKAEAMGNNQDIQGTGSSSHGDEYGMMGYGNRYQTTPTGQTDLPKQKVIDYWGWVFSGGKRKVCNAIVVGKEMVQYEVTDYKIIPWFIGHSYANPRYPWSMSFIDPLIDPQVELNDRQSEEGDLIRIGAHMKFLVVNMPDFDEKSLRPGSGQVIFIEGEGADFRPLQMSITPFPSEAYLNRTMEHMFTLGLPKIAFAAGTAPYTGRVGAIQYQSVVDPVNKLRVNWEKVLKDLTKIIQQYFIDFFPETHGFMALATDEGDGPLTIRMADFDWENILPMSKSDMIVDASTLYDRDAISTRKYLELAGMDDAPRIIKELKKESQDEELFTARGKFKELSQAATTAKLDQQKALMDQQEEAGALQGAVDQATAPQPKPIMHENQNQGTQRGISSTKGAPQTGQVSQMGAMRQITQNLNAKG